MLENLIKNNRLNLDLLKELKQKPNPFTAGEEKFWDDPHISKSLLEAHLNPNIDAASRRTETIEKAVANIVDYLKIDNSVRLLDLGCGPGLYCKRFAKIGMNVTGIDFSNRSIEYAVQDSATNSLNIKYKYMNYLEMDYVGEFDVVTMIYGDLCVLSNENKDILLKNIHNALKPGGHFIFDVSTRSIRQKCGLKNNWYVADSGFWKPEKHIVLETGFDYPDENIYLDQYTVIEETGGVSVYRNWFHDYSLEVISNVLIKCGFTVEKYWSDLTGEPYKDNSDWIGLVAVKE